MWKKLDEEAKKKYKNQFQVNFDKYKLELEAYYKKKGIDPKKDKAKAKALAKAQVCIPQLNLQANAQPSETESLGKRKPLTNASSEVAEEESDSNGSSTDSVV